MNKEQEEAKAIMEAIEHPETKCPVCWKNIGICKHTRGLK